MTFSDALEVALGLSFLFVLMSLALTSTMELIELKLKNRSANLLRGIEELLNDPPKQPADPHAVVKTVYDHPLVRGLFRGTFDTAGRGRDSVLPSYIPSASFAKALIDQAMSFQLAAAQTAATLPRGADAVERLRFAVERIGNEQVRRAMLTAIEHGQGDLAAVERELARWYDSAMDRVAGWYKRWTQRYLFWLGLAAAVVLNVNAITVADSLFKDATLRRALAAKAESYAARDGLSATKESDKAVEQLKGTGLAIGWSRQAVDQLRRQAKVPLSTDCTRALHPDLCAFGGYWLRDFLLWLPGILLVAIGYVATALAMTLGAPFWFDVLNRLMVIRATVKPHEKSREERSQDPQDPKEGMKVTLAAPPAAPVVAPPSASAEDDQVFADDLKPYERPREDDDGVVRTQPLTVTV